METNLSTPKAPIQLKIISKTYHTVQLQWKQSIHQPFADYFHVQYRKQLIEIGGTTTTTTQQQQKETKDASSARTTEMNTFHWKDVLDPKNIPSTLTLSTPEIQEITTLVDENSSITSGYFWLKLNIPYDDPTLHTNILESNTISKPIAFNASESDVEDAIRNIRGVQYVRVFRYEPGKWGISTLPYLGTYSWRIEFSVIGQNAPLFQVHKDTLDGLYSGGYIRCQIRRLLIGEAPTYKDEIESLVEGLESETYYEFRIRGGNSEGNGPWSDILSDVKTESFILDKPPAKPTHDQLNSPNVKMIPGIGRRAGNDEDADYLSGAAVGGFDRQDGTNGLVVIIQYNQQKFFIPSRTSFYYQGRSEHFKVSDGNLLKRNNNQMHNTEYLDLKLWGGGGAGGGTPKNHTGKVFMDFVLSFCSI